MVQDGKMIMRNLFERRMLNSTGVNVGNGIRYRKKPPMNVYGGEKVFAKADFYADQLKNNKSYKAETETYKNEGSWTNYTDENGTSKGSIAKWGDDTYIRVGKETFVDKNSDGIVDRSVIHEGNIITHFNARF